MLSRVVALLVAVLVPGLVLTACSPPLQPRTTADRSTPPDVGACYRLTPKDARAASSDAGPVSCSSPHTSQTFAVGTLPRQTGTTYDDSRHGRWIYPRCERALEQFLSVDESLAMRIQLSWVWFRPSERAWAQGARWYRCDVVGAPPARDASSGPADPAAKQYRELPTVTKGLFRARPPEEWLTCARGDALTGSSQVLCSQAHDWRAVTTIKLGQPGDRYPGDRLVEVRSRNFCSDSVLAWLDYPATYAFGYTWFHEAEWKTGNRRSICWAKTSR